MLRIIDEFSRKSLAFRVARKLRASEKAIAALCADAKILINAVQTTQRRCHLTAPIPLKRASFGNRSGDEAALAMRCATS